MLPLRRIEILQHEMEKLGISWECGERLGENSEFWWLLGEATEPWNGTISQWGPRAGLKMVSVFNRWFIKEKKTLHQVLF